MDRTISEAYIMHKNHLVAAVTLTSGGEIGNIRYNKAELDHIPLGGQMNDIRFHEWWRDRAIPKTRHGVIPALQKLGYASTQNMLVDNLALSLTDCYWLKPADTDISWEDINLFDNPFEDYFGMLTFDSDDPLDLRNKTGFIPASSQGEVRKKWCIDQNGSRFLVKGNYGESFQQSINEVFASHLHEAFGFENYVSYSLTSISLDDHHDAFGCSCKCFCNNNVELISAWEVLQTVKTRKNQSLFHPLRDACIRLGITAGAFDKFISYEIMTDFLISNFDRHMNNIAVLRNPDTLEMLGMAPIYDNGNSMFFNEPLSSLEKGMRPLKTNSFIQDEASLLKYVSDRNLLDLNKLGEPDFDIYYNDIPERHIRIPYIKERFMKKFQMLDSFQHGQDIWKARG